VTAAQTSACRRVCQCRRLRDENEHRWLAALREWRSAFGAAHCPERKIENAALRHGLEDVRRDGRGRPDRWRDGEEW